ncbi:flavin reductase family protein [Aquamicrobium soli]|jgi:flavin reductase (DIM6/NTAB) family NADH-FMN oxidoreductase RutF|uniref:Flavin reductase family protein n=1 Tax=Aquamicrobium soli TaxID=1811518 RepID=A0ABV7KD15_9HYPH
MSPDPMQFWTLLGQRVVGSTVITVDGPAGPSGFLGLSATHVCASPPTMLVSIDEKTSACGDILARRRFAVNYLPADSERVAGLFAGKSGVSGAARFEEGQWTSLETGCPIFVRAVGAADCEVEEVIHRHGVAIVIGRVVATMTNDKEMPLLHHRGRTMSLTAASSG